MRTFLILIASVMLFAAGGNGLHAAMPEEDVVSTLIRVPVSGSEDVKKLIELGLQIELNIIRNEVAEGFISKRNLERIRNAGFNVSVVEEDTQKTITSRKDKYYSYDDVKELLEKWNQEHPDITKVEVANKSLDGKDIWLLRIFGAPDTAARQRILLTGACHGNEKIGTECAMRVADHLLSNYERDQRVKQIVDSSEFIIVPIVNVDGFPSKRTLSNGKDPNRCYGFQVGGGGASNPYEYPEMQIHRNLIIEGPFFNSYDYHSGVGPTLMSPWFCSVSSKPDDAEYSKLESIYKITQSEELKNPESLQAGGIGCDGVYGACGGMAFLPEVYGSGANPKADGIEEVTDLNLNSLLDVLLEMQKGVRGRVKCAKTGTYLFARITVENEGASVFTYQKSGAYFKYITSASDRYEVTAFANGYKTQTRTVQVRSSNSFTDVDFNLEPDPEQKFAALVTLAIKVGNSLSLEEIYSCLELNDGNGLSLDGYIVLDMGPTSPITDHPDIDDITVHATNNDKYTVSVAYDVDDLENSANELGEGEGTTSFDLADISLDSARFVKISSASGSPSIDAIEAEPRDMLTAVNTFLVESWKNEKPKVISYTPTNGLVVKANIPVGDYAITIYNVQGKKIHTLSQGTAKSSSNRLFQWDCRDMNNNRCASGTYLLHIKASSGKWTLKIPLMQ